MITINNVEVSGWEAAIRGMRNPLNSWDKSDSGWDSKVNESDNVNEVIESIYYHIRENDLNLMKRLASAGSDHAKYRRFIVVTFDLVAPLYFLKEWDTYKISTVSNSTSTMHKIHSKEFTLEDFSCDNLDHPSRCMLKDIIAVLNYNREAFITTKDKAYWWNMIQLLPSSYNQLRTVQLNYEVLANMYHSRKNHKLDEWRNFCTFVEQLPYSELITG